MTEFERRTAFLSSVDRRTNLAEANVQRRLVAWQVRAREEIERAQEVARKVRSLWVGKGCQWSYDGYPILN